VHVPASHDVPCVQPTQAPIPEHTWSTPHDVPPATFDEAPQTGAPVPHATAPVTHAPASQLVPTVQSPQVPVEEQTRFMPQLMPVGRLPVVAQL